MHGGGHMHLWKEVDTLCNTYFICMSKRLHTAWCSMKLIINILYYSMITIVLDMHAFVSLRSAYINLKFTCDGRHLVCGPWLASLLAVRNVRLSSCLVHASLCVQGTNHLSYQQRYIASCEWFVSIFSRASSGTCCATSWANFQCIHCCYTSLI